MKSSCVSHEREPLIIIRQSYVDFCNGNHCAAALISFFEYWHNIKLDMQKKAQFANSVAANHGEEPTQDTSLYQFHTADDLIDGMVGLFGITKIRDAIEQLKGLGVISVHRNPNPRYKFDNTRYFLFNPDALKIPHRPVKNDTSSVENDGRCVENNRPSVKNDTTITETPTETPTEKDKQTNTREFEKNEQSIIDNLTSEPKNFIMPFDWQPSQQEFLGYCMNYGVDPKKLTPEILKKFIGEARSNEQKHPESKWCKFLATYLKKWADNPTFEKKPNPHIYKPEQEYTPEPPVDRFALPDGIGKPLHGQKPLTEEEKSRRLAVIEEQRKKRQELIHG